MNLELGINLSLKASHSLEEREEVHPHLWEIQVGLRGDLTDGRVVSLTEARDFLEKLLTPLQGSFLNENNYLDASCRENPTCENLVVFLFELFGSRLKELDPEKSPHLSFIQVAIWDKGAQLGFAKLTVDKGL